MSRKIKFISETGTDNFERVLSGWIAENQDKQILSISHTATELTLPAPPGHTLKGYEFTAVILYNEVDHYSEASFIGASA